MSKPTVRQGPIDRGSRSRYNAIIECPSGRGIEFYNEAGQLVLAYRVYRCWVSEYQALPDLEADAKGVAIESITLQHEGWERDHEVSEPAEPSF